MSSESGASVNIAEMVVVGPEHGQQTISSSMIFDDVKFNELWNINSGSDSEKKSFHHLSRWTQWNF